MTSASDLWVEDAQSCAIAHLERDLESVACGRHLSALPERLHTFARASGNRVTFGDGRMVVGGNGRLYETVCRVHYDGWGWYEAVGLFGVADLPELPHRGDSLWRGEIGGDSPLRRLGLHRVEMCGFLGCRQKVDGTLFCRRHR